MAPLHVMKHFTFIGPQHQIDSEVIRLLCAIPPNTENPNTKNPNTENPNTKNPNTENPNTENPNTETQTQRILG